MGQVTTGTKMVLASKLSSQVSFQPDKNFQQSFASWVKQGQTTNSGKPGKSYRTSALHACTVPKTSELKNIIEIKFLPLVTVKTVTMSDSQLYLKPGACSFAFLFMCFDRSDPTKSAEHIPLWTTS